MLVDVLEADEDVDDDDEVLEVEVLVGVGISELRAPVTPYLVAHSVRLNPSGQQKVSPLVSAVQ